MGYHTDAWPTKGQSDPKEQERNHVNSRLQASSTGSESETDDKSPNLPQLPKAVFDFFSGVQDKGYPQKQAGQIRARPWMKVWDGLVEPDAKGELWVACPKKCDYGSNLGGY
ncbi:hypothetical protein BP5796_10775 [Coleophoma crateriformis]|uniref:Uncharacterized protein n=1 Tax=Coleophoma crateriformis TaxID=565419 RepID=A0A3D8QR35_9HELO|nr:hypothetical protein BP5796_10775 [Coleophoma crateriformis]